jgi:hypothetical protein
MAGVLLSEPGVGGCAVPCMACRGSAVRVRLAPLITFSFRGAIPADFGLPKGGLFCCGAPVPHTRIVALVVDLAGSLTPPACLWYVGGLRGKPSSAGSGGDARAADEAVKLSPGAGRSNC